MQRALLIAALTAVACSPTIAQATNPGSVTVYGLFDVAARSIKGNDTVQVLSNEGRAASRLGIRGSEDLGGGLRASFQLEHGFNADDGTASAIFWQRRSTVSLSGAFGELRLGRNKNATRTVVDDFDPFNTSGMVSLTTIYAPLGGLQLNRVDNQISYFLPSAARGLYGNIEVSAGEGVAPNSNTHRSLAGRLGYRQGGLNVSPPPMASTASAPS